MQPFVPFVVWCVQAERFMQQLTEFAGEHGMSAGPLKNLMKSVLLVPQGESNSHSQHAFVDQDKQWQREFT